MSKRRYGQTPLPLTQIAIIMAIRLAEPVHYTVIFPFINQMVEELKVTDNPDRIGFYSGLVESIFSLVQFLTVYHWAKVSDRIGRRPVVLFGLLGVVASGAGFGLSTSFVMMILMRCLSGALNGNAAVIKASLGDITDETNATDAFALYGLVWTVGTIIGTSLGGTLSHPYENLPALFGGYEILRVHPFFLPCLTSAGLTVLGLVFAFFFYRESLPSVEPAPGGFLSYFASKSTGHKRKTSSLSSASDLETLVDPDSPSDRLMKSSPGERKAWGFWDLIALRKVRIMLVTLFLNQFVGGAWSAVSLLFLFDKNNGLGMSPSAIGTSLAINGLVTIACQLLLLNRIQRYLGLARAYKALSFGWIVIFFLLPHLRTIMEATEIATEFGYPERRGWRTAISVNLLLAMVTVCGMANSLLMVLVNFSSPDKTAFGAVNGISTAVGCMSRVVGPSLIGSLYAISMDGQVLGGRLWWIFMIAMSALSFMSCLFVEEVVASTGSFEEDEALELSEDGFSKYKPLQAGLHAGVDDTDTDV
ncbi:hypothetical protein P7C73_g4573, partial [Tremellales sp. Uapishka_1]